MRKFRFTIASLMIVGFLSATLFTSCGGKKEEAAEETTEQAGDHPSSGSEHPSSGSEHPAADSTATDSTSAQ